MSRDLYLRSISQTASHLDAIVADMQTAVNSFSVGQLPDRAAEQQRINLMMTPYLENTEHNSRVPVKAVYYRIGEDCLFTSEGRVDYQSFEKSLANRIDLNRSGFFSHLNQDNRMNTCLLKDANGGENPAMQMVAFFFPVYDGQMRRHGTFAFLLDSADIVSLVKDYLGIRPDYLYVYSSTYNSILAIYENVPQTQKGREAALRANVNMVSRLAMEDGVTYDVLHYKTELYGLQIISCVQLKDLYVDTEGISRNMLLIGLGLGLLILLGAFLLARYFYQPVRKLLEQVDAEEEPDAEADEFEVINRHLITIQTEMQTLQERLAMQRPMVRDRLLQALIRGSIDEKGIQQLENVCPALYSEGHYACVALTSLPLRTEAVHRIEMLEEIKLNGASAHGVYLDDEHIFTWVIFCSGDDTQRTVYGMHLLKTLHEIGLQNAKVYLGNMVTATSEVSRSFLEAYITFNHHHTGTEEVELYTNNLMSVSGEVSGTKQLTNESASELYLQSFRTVNVDTSLNLLKVLLESTNSNSMLNASYNRYDLYAQTLRVSEPEVVTKFRDEQRIMEIIQDEEVFCQTMEQMTRANCKAVEQRRSNHLDGIKQEILNYLREHYCEVSFSLNVLSEQIGYSATYINRCLREETGYSFIQYLSLMRINRAKELLTSSDRRIKEIVEMVGYQDLASFTRKFKEYEGVTPSQYREVNSQNDP